MRNPKQFTNGAAACRRAIIASLTLVLQASFVLGIETNETAGLISIHCPDYVVEIHKQGFCYGFRDSAGKEIAPPNGEFGLEFGGGRSVSTQLVSRGPKTVSLVVTNDKGAKAKVEIEPGAHFVRFGITQSEPGRMLARIGGIGPAFGLADHAAFAKPDTELTGYSDGNFQAQEPPGHRRLVSNFVISPKRGIAVVNMEKTKKLVRVRPDDTAQGTASATSMPALYYFLGNPQQIYQAFLDARRREGYEVYKPKSEFFGVGWEAFGALGWQTNEKTVRENIGRYLDEGYPIDWMVVGSGFWPNEDPAMCATTSFGMWDKKRYPDPRGFIESFKKRGIKFFLGLRISFIHDGPYSAEGVAKGYFLKDNGVAKAWQIGFPKRPAYMLDGANPEAVKWYAGLCQKWIDDGVDGFKEDLFNYRNVGMMDGNIDRVNEALMDKGVFIMGRNGYLGSAMDVSRIEDFNFDQNQDRGPVNVLAFAYSGFPNTYPDIIGGTFGEHRKMPPMKDPVMKTYMSRAARFASVNPAMAVGMGPWNFDDEVGKVMLESARMHARLHPYIYSAAVDSWETGFPYTMTPLPLAWPEDPAVYGRENDKVRGYQWMLGQSLMACPLYGNDYATAKTRDVYLPAGRWMDYDTGEIHAGPKLLEDYPMPVEKTPLFVGGKGVLVTRDLKDRTLHAAIYPIAPRGTEYRFTGPDGKSRSMIRVDVADWGRVVVRDESSNTPVPVRILQPGNVVTFPLKEGRDYRVGAGE